MTYGNVTIESREALAAAGLLDALELDHLPEDRMAFEIDVVCNGALDESFEVRPEMADDVADVIFEAIVANHPEVEEVEVSVYERGGEYAEERYSITT